MTALTVRERWVLAVLQDEDMPTARKAVAMVLACISDDAGRNISAAEHRVASGLRITRRTMNRHAEELRADFYLARDPDDEYPDRHRLIFGRP